MNKEILENFLKLGHEARGVEFKGPGSRDDKEFLAKIIRAVLGMSNHREGGYVIIGISEQDNTLTTSGLSETQIRTWNFDDLSDSINRYSEPSIIFETQVVELNGANILIIKVEEFSEIPTICKKDYHSTVTNKLVLRKGACYVRSNSKPETTEIPTQEEMRDLLGLAVKKGVKKFIGQMEYAGIKLEEEKIQNSAELYRKERGEF